MYAIAGILLIALVLWDAFETIIMARRVARRLRLTRVFYRSTWAVWARLSLLARAGNARENFLSIYGPLSLLLLLMLWAAALVVGFALVQWGAGTSMVTPAGRADFLSYFYFSGSTFFTLGLGDVRSDTAAGQLLTILEAGTGFGFLAIVIGYLPGLSEAYSKREVNISLLDARAGSPPSAVELLRRHTAPGAAHELERLLEEWERWAAELLESHISFPVLAYFRSEHDNQSWVAALTTMLDTCALLLAGGKERQVWRARLTFAITRHAAVDLCHVLEREKDVSGIAGTRLMPNEAVQLAAALCECGITDQISPQIEQKLTELRRTYEPYCYALATHLKMPLPAWLPATGARDNWQGGGVARDNWQAGVAG